MKLKVTVDLGDLWTEEDENIGEVIASSIRNDIVREVKVHIKEAIEVQIRQKVDIMVQDLLTKKSARFIGNYLRRGTIKHCGDDISLEEYIKYKFTRDSGWSSPNKLLEKLATTFSRELKDRYDVLFASQIVAKLGDNNLLVDRNVAKLIMDKKQ